MWKGGPLLMGFRLVSLGEAWWSCCLALWLSGLHNVVFSFQKSCYLTHQGEAKTFQELPLLLGALASVVPGAHSFADSLYLLRGFRSPASPGAQGCGCK